MSCLLTATLAEDVFVEKVVTLGCSRAVWKVSKKLTIESERNCWKCATNELDQFSDFEIDGNEVHPTHTVGWRPRLPNLRIHVRLGRPYVSHVNYRWRSS